MKKYKAVSGATLVEYGFIAALILVASITTITVLGGNINSAMANLETDLNKHAKSSKFGSARRPPGSPVATIPNGAGVIGAPGSGQEQVCYSSGWCVNIPTVAAGTRLSSTTGALGGQMTRDFANVLRQLGEQLAADPNADPQLLSLIRTLANQGHSIGDSLDTANTWCPPGTNCGQYDANGGLISDDIMNIMGGINGVQSGFQSTNTQLQNYLSSHPGALPPEVVGIINLEVGQINAVADAYESQPISQTCSAAGDTACFGWNVTDTTLVHQNANTICTSGGGSGCIR